MGLFWSAAFPNLSCSSQPVVRLVGRKSRASVLAQVDFARDGLKLAMLNQGDASPSTSVNPHPASACIWRGALASVLSPSRPLTHHLTSSIPIPYANFSFLPMDVHTGPGPPARTNDRSPSPIISGERRWSPPRRTFDRRFSQRRRLPRVAVLRMDGESGVHCAPPATWRRALSSPVRPR